MVHKLRAHYTDTLVKAIRRLLTAMTNSSENCAVNLMNQEISLSAQSVSRKWETSSWTSNLLLCEI